MNRLKLALSCILLGALLAAPVSAAAKSARAVGNDNMPHGSIILWAGTEFDVPPGWHACNGEMNTPDLRDRFIVGAGPSYPVDSQGGSYPVTLSVEQMPSHSHGVSDPGHSHSISNMRVTNLSSDDGGTNPYATGSGVQNTNSSKTGVTIQPEGGGQPFDNRPPYFAVLYIMKL